jgi:DNA repair photolyase
MGGLSDPLPKVEKTEKITLRTIELLNKHNIRYLITTKSALIAEPEYMNVLDKNLAHIQISLTCLDDNRAYEYEKADPPSARIEALYALQSEGHDVMLRLSPYIPEFMDIEHLNTLHMNKTLLEFLRVNSFIKENLRGVDYEKYTVKHGGYRHLPLHEKFHLLKKIKLPNVSVAEYVPQHHKFWVRNQNPSKNFCCNLRCATSL